jgi:hypothetical protein
MGIWKEAFLVFDGLDVITADLNKHHGREECSRMTREVRPESRMNQFLVLENALLQESCCTGFHESRYQYLKEPRLLSPYREAWRREAIAHSPRVLVPCHLPIQPHMIKTDDWATEASTRAGGNLETNRTPNTMLVFHMIVEKKPKHFITLVDIVTDIHPRVLYHS